MLVAGAMAGSCVSLMKHWEGCSLFQWSGGSLACQDAPPGRRGSCQRAPRLPRCTLPLDCHTQPFQGCGGRCQDIPQHNMSACSPSTQAQCVWCRALKLVLLRKHLPLPRDTSPPSPTPASEDPLLTPRRMPPSPVLDAPSPSSPAWGSVVT